MRILQRFYLGPFNLYRDELFGSIYAFSCIADWAEGILYNNNNNILILYYTNKKNTVDLNINGVIAALLLKAISFK